VIENQKQYGVTTAENIRIFLEHWPKVKVEFEETWQSLTEGKELLFSKDAIGFSWCHLYELPIKQHMVLPLTGFLQDDRFLKIFQSFSSSKDQIGFIPEVFSQIDSYFEGLEPPSRAEAIELMPVIAVFFGASLSVFHSLRCVLYHGCFLNELIDRARDGEEKALYDAIRLDPTVVGCKPAIELISKAALLQDKSFFAKLKAALNGNIAKRKQANYQKMRLVLEILHEAKSEKLNDDQLYGLFVKTLKLYSWNEREGGNAKALRKFVDTYMKQNSTT
jgi:hypothetical protein